MRADRQSYKCAVEILRTPTRGEVEKYNILSTALSVGFVFFCDAKVDQKRLFDQIGQSSAFGGLQKRAIAYRSLFRRLNNPFDEMSRSSLYRHAFHSAYPWSRGLRKKAIDSIDHSSVFGGLHKKAVDAVYGTSAGDGLWKKAFDSIAHDSSFDELDNKSFDHTNDASAYGGLRKKSFDRIGGSGAFGRIDKKAFDSIDHPSTFGELNKKSFDSIDHSGAFGGLDKKGL